MIYTSPITLSILVSGRVKCIELENFMCHEKLKVEFDLENNNCFYIGGPNGSKYIQHLNISCRTN